MIQQRVRFRCSACGKRYSTEFPKDYFICSKCGHTKRKMTLDEQVCYCAGYHFPHREGSLWCDHYKGERSDQDWEERLTKVPEF